MNTQNSRSTNVSQVRSNTSARRAHSSVSRRTIPPGVVIAAIALLLTAASAGGYYEWNGGWATASQQQAKFVHDIAPVLAAKAGRTGPLERENAERKARGEAPLQLPPDRHASANEQRQKLLQLQQQIQARPANSMGQ